MGKTGQYEDIMRPKVAIWSPNGAEEGTNSGYKGPISCYRGPIRGDREHTFGHSWHIEGDF